MLQRKTPIQNPKVPLAEAKAVIMYFFDNFSLLDRGIMPCQGGVARVFPSQSRGRREAVHVGRATRQAFV